jgi:hypothetical protein
MVQQQNEGENYTSLGDPRLIDYDGLRLCLRTAATNEPIFHPPGDT